MLSLPPPTAAALPRSCAGPVNRSRGVDLAGAVHGGGRRRAVARQDAQAWQAPAAAQHRSAGGRSGLGAAAGREHPLDGPGTCQGGRSEPAFGATHPGSSPTRAAPYPDVQTVEAHAVVLSVDEKSQIQALDRTQPGLPMKKGRAGTMTHDYKRHGTTTLFATLNVLDGTVIGRNMQRHRHQELIRFLNPAEAQVPVRMAIHAVVDNYATHKHPKVQKWLARHPRWTFHFTPTSASWLKKASSPNSRDGASSVECSGR